MTTDQIRNKLKKGETELQERFHVEAIKEWMRGDIEKQAIRVA